MAQRHAVTLQGAQAIDAVVRLKYREAQQLVTSALTAMQGYVNNDVQATVFSPEGDIMHQTMDCIFMGPYAKVNYWPGDSPGRQSVPAWYET